jgi:predicted amidophosphoribosyltransferase
VAETFQYVCTKCSFDVLSGAQVHECPHCGAELKLQNVFHHATPAPPPNDRRVETALDDVLRGFDKLLSES